MIFRPAIAMIELIFAIVIMGIVFLSVPMVTMVAAKSGYVAIQQEAIGMASSHLNMVMNFHWDNNNADEAYPDHILNVSLSATPDLLQLPGGRRGGTPALSERSFIRGDGNNLLTATSPALLGIEGSAKNDIDDFIGYSTLVNYDPAHDDYAEGTGDINMTTAVTYMDDNVSGGTYLDPGADGTLTFNPNFANTGFSSNIKHIQVTLTDESGADELAKTIVLHGFSSNIGSFELEHEVK